MAGPVDTVSQSDTYDNLYGEGIAAVRIQAYDEELTRLLTSSTTTLSDLQLVFNIKILLDSAYKQIEKKLLNLSEEERKSELKNYLGSINGRMVVGITCVLVLANVFDMFVKIAPQQCGTVLAGPSAWKPGSPALGTNGQPALGLNHANGPAAAAALLGEKRVKKLEVICEGAGKIADPLLKLAQANEGGYQTLHRSNVDFFNYMIQSVLGQAIQQAGGFVQEGLRNTQEAMQKEHDARTAIARSM